VICILVCGLQILFVNVTGDLQLSGYITMRLPLSRSDLSFYFLFFSPANSLYTSYEITQYISEGFFCNLYKCLVILQRCFKLCVYMHKVFSNIIIIMVQLYILRVSQKYMYEKGKATPVTGRGGP
jgi:hypothetical protein